MKNGNSHFRAGRGVFVCSICKRRTRDAGQAISSDCCNECYELAGLQNAIFDGVETVAGIAQERDRLFKIATDRGGDRTRIMREFPELFPDQPQ